jgi:hypothetical protein
MSTRVVSLYTYRTRGDSWTSPQLGVLRFIRCLKHESPIGSREGILVNGRFHTIGDENRHDAFTWFAEMSLEVLQGELGHTRVSLVPIPNCTSTVEVAECRTASLAHAIAHTSGNAAVVADILRWDERMPSARSGDGTRDALELHRHLRTRSPAVAASDRPHVLIDDVTTGGGHIRACAAFLRTLGAEVTLAICAAKSDQDPPDDPFQRRVDVLPGL